MSPNNVWYILNPSARTTKISDFGCLRWAPDIKRLVNLCTSPRFYSTDTVSSSKPPKKGRGLIWVYDINEISINNGLVSGSPFLTKTSCGQVLNINRNTIRLYLYSDKLLFNKWVISSKELSKELLSNYIVPSVVW